MKSWFGCTPADDWVSMGVFSDGSYGTPEGVMFSFPVTTKEGRWSIVQVGSFSFAIIPLINKIAMLNRVPLIVSRDGYFFEEL
jgi:hypothetical protein